MHLARLGYPQYPGIDHGAPVEAAFSPDGRYAYVSNYSMYGSGFGPEGSDSCTPSSGYDRSFLYRVDMRKLAIDRAYHVGEVPKVVAVTPDGRYVLATNWCSWDLSVVSTWATARCGGSRSAPTRAASRSSRTAARRTSPSWAGPSSCASTSTTGRRGGSTVGQGPRARGARARTAATSTSRSTPRAESRSSIRGRACRARQGVDRQRAAQPHDRARREGALRRQLRERHRDEAAGLRHEPLQTIDACFHPIGITYDRATRRVWVACYTGSIRVYNDW